MHKLHNTGPDISRHIRCSSRAKANTNAVHSASSHLQAPVGWPQSSTTSLNSRHIVRTVLFVFPAVIVKDRLAYIYPNRVRKSGRRTKILPLFFPVVPICRQPNLSCAQSSIETCIYALNFALRANIKPPYLVIAIVLSAHAPDRPIPCQLHLTHQ